MKRREEARKIARKRIKKLLSLAFSETDLSLARRYVELAKRIGMRTRTKIPRKIKRFICRNCMAPLVPGRNAVVRLREGKIFIRCLECGHVRVIPYKPAREKNL